MIEELCHRFGLGWQQMRTVGGRELKPEIDGVSLDLVAEFSQRRATIQQTRDQVVADFQVEHGRPPTGVEWRRLDRLSWRRSRSAKVHRSLAEMTTEWTERARPWVGAQPESWVVSLAGRADLPALCSEDLTDDMVAASSARWGASAPRNSVPTAIAPAAPASRPRAWRGLPPGGPRGLNPPRPSSWTRGCSCEFNFDRRNRHSVGSDGRAGISCTNDGVRRIPGPCRVLQSSTDGGEAGVMCASGCRFKEHAVGVLSRRG